MAAVQPPAWTEIRVLVPEGWQELVAEALHLGPCTSVAFGRPSLASEVVPGTDWVRTFVLREQDGPELRSRIERALAQLALRTGAPELASLRASFHELPPEDYANSWRKSWKPFRLGRFAILPPDDERALRPTDILLTLEPGGAFGTGRHATTRMCLRALEHHLRPGSRVLDAGCGNGILSVAAALLGAHSCLGFDLDPAAIPYAQQLAGQNRVSAACDWRIGSFDVLQPTDTSYDLILANLYADTIQARAADLSRRLHPFGTFIFSGCLHTARAATLAALTNANLTVHSLQTRGRWDTYTGRRTG
jgi:ribosomal protein L11 methyltransferase